MRYLVLTDIHANLEALDACLAAAEKAGYDRALVLGDVVGYGADPNEVVVRVQSLDPIAIVRGNHDKVACHLEPADSFNAVAKIAADWTFDALTPEHRHWLAALPAGPSIVDETVEICHGSPVDEDEYIFDELDAEHALSVSTRPICFFGHTHYPATFELKHDGGGMSGWPGGVAMPSELVRSSKYLINPGSVGQPRDGDPRAAFAIVDTDAWRLDRFRVPYAIETAQDKMIEVGLPEVLARRLAVGR